MRICLAALPLIILAVPALAQAPYRAAGTEPFWSLTIDARTMRLEQPGEKPVVVARPTVRTDRGGERYVTPELIVDVSRARCSDGMSDRVYRDMVLIKVGQKSLRGCGGGVQGERPTVMPPLAAPTAARPASPVVAQPLPAGQRSPLTNTLWSVWQVNGRAVQTTRPMLVNFTGNRVEGRICNLFGGPYTMAGERLQAGTIAARRATCRGAEAATEATLFAMLRQPMIAKVSRWGTLVLSGRRDTVTLRPVRR